MTSRASVSASFLVFGVTVGGLIPRVPALKDHLHLTDGQVGLALLGVSVGGVAGSIATRFVRRTGARTAVRWGIPAVCLAAVGPGLAPNLLWLIASLFVAGFLWAFIDVFENAMGAQVERVEARPLINGFHGFWSLGAFAGSLVAGGAAFASIAPVVQFVATGAIVAIGSVGLLRALPELEGAGNESVPAQTLVVPAALMALVVVGFAGVIAEGGTSDWSALFLRELSHVSPGVAAAGFSGFTVAATVVRFRADRLTARTSQVVVARTGAAVAAVGLVVAIAFPALPTAVLGFTLVGMGTAVILPLTFAAGANMHLGGSPLAAVMAATYAGTIAGPPLIGAAADHFGLRVAMGIPLLAAVLVLGLAGRLASAPTRRPNRT